MTTTTTTKSARRCGVSELPVAKVDASHWTNPRGRVDTDVPEFAELVESIRAQGLLEPVVVGPAMLEGARHPLIAGWRRLAACQAAGQDTIDAHQRPDITDERAALRAALAENTARQDMTPSAEAAALARLMDLGDTQAQAARAIGVSERTARERLRLLTLPAAVRDAIDTQAIPSTATRQMQQIADASPAAAAAVATKITSGEMQGAALLDSEQLQDTLAELPDSAALLRLSPNVSIRELPLGDDKDAKELRARARKASHYGGDYLSLRPAGNLAKILADARTSGHVLKLGKDRYTGEPVEYVAGADTIHAVLAAAIELAERQAADRKREQDRHAATRETASAHDPAARAREAARQANADVDERARPHAEQMNAEIAQRIIAMAPCSLTGAVARLILHLATSPMPWSGLEGLVNAGYEIVSLADSTIDEPLATTVAHARTPEAATTAIVAGLTACFLADTRGSDMRSRGRLDRGDELADLVLAAAEEQQLLPDRARRLQQAYAEHRKALAYHERDGARRRVLSELADASNKGLQLDALYQRCKECKRPGDEDLPRHAAANVSFREDFSAAARDLVAEQLIKVTEREDAGGAIHRHHAITPAGRKHLTSTPTSPPVLADIDTTSQPAAAAQQTPAPILVHVTPGRAEGGADAEPVEAELQPNRQDGRPNVRKVTYTASRTAAWVAAKRIKGLPADQAADTTPKKGSGARRDDALAKITAQPGITIPELAQAMGLKQNHLYRLLPELQKAGQVHKQGRGWHPGKAQET